MARFRVYRLKSGDELVLDLQADLLDDLPSRVMAPLSPIDETFWSIGRLNPRVVIEGQSYILSTQRLAAAPVSQVGDLVADLSKNADEITAALDFLFQGFRVVS